MSKQNKKNKRHKYLQAIGVEPEALIETLKARAEVKMVLLGHRPGAWYSAKKKFGKAAVGVTCHMCGRRVVVLPFGNSQARMKLAREAPGLRGSGVLEACQDGSERVQDVETIGV